MKKSRAIESIIYDYRHAVDDLIDDYQRRLAKIPTWTNEKRQLVQELEDSLKKAEFGGSDCDHLHVEEQTEHYISSARVGGGLASRPNDDSLWRINDAHHEGGYSHPAENQRSSMSV